MNKTFSLLKTSLTQDMGLFKINSKRMKGRSKILVPIMLAFFVMSYIGSAAYTLMEQFKEAHLEYVALTIILLLFSVITIFEGLYKSSSLLFNCKDDDLLLSLPISRRMVLFVRMFKFYAFEFLFNSLFILPAMIVYAIYVNPAWTYYLVSIISLIIIPIVPIVISCLFGFVTTYISSKFKGKNLVQTIITMSVLLVVIYLSYNLDGVSKNIVENALVINNTICNIYYPIGGYINLVNDFNILSLIVYILINVFIFAVVVLIIGKFYFKLNSKMKSVTVVHNKKPYVVKTRSKVRSFIKKEFDRFVQTPVFIINAGFGLVLFVAGCIALCLNFNAIAVELMNKVESLKIDVIIGYLPTLVLALVAMCSFMTSITSSMISLEGKSINILKSLPIKSSMIVLYKVLASFVIILPCLFVGDLIVFIYFKFDIISIICILYASVLLPFICELIGIMCNLKFPKMDAINDTEIVKQSMSTFVAVMVGMVLAFVSAGYLVGMMVANIPNTIIMISFLVIFTIVALLLWLRVSKTADESFNNIQV